MHFAVLVEEAREAAKLESQIAALQMKLKEERSMREALEAERASGRPTTDPTISEVHIVDKNARRNQTQSLDIMGESAAIIQSLQAEVGWSEGLMV